MRVSYEWLKDMVDVPADPQGLITELVRTGTEVAAVERVGADITKVVTSQVGFMSATMRAMTSVLAWPTVLW